MLPTSGRPTKPRGQKAATKRRFAWDAFAMGVVGGMLIVSVSGFGLLYFFGFFAPFEAASTPPVGCPATPDLVVICPQVVPAVVVTATPAPTETPTPTATPDFAATATVACATFQGQFPATPCP